MRLTEYVRHSSPYAVFLIFFMLCGSPLSAIASVGQGDSPVFSIGFLEYGTGMGDSSTFTLDAHRMTSGHGDSRAFEVIAAVADAKSMRQNDPGQTTFVESSYGYESRSSVSYRIQLDGSASLAASSYSWEQIAGQMVTLSDAESPEPTFDAPQWDGSTELTKTQARLSFQLTINPGNMLGERTDEVTVYIRIPGDANGDNLVNAFDLAKLRQIAPAADFDGNGRVDAFDVSIFRLNAGRRRTVE